MAITPPPNRPLSGPGAALRQDQDLKIQGDVLRDVVERVGRTGQPDQGTQARHRTRVTETGTARYRARYSGGAQEDEELND